VWRQLCDPIAARMVETMSGTLGAAGLPAALTPIAAASRATLAVHDLGPVSAVPAPPLQTPGTAPAAGATPSGDGSGARAGAGAGGGIGAGDGDGRPVRHRTALFNEPGPLVTQTELEAFLRDYEARLERVAAVVISGSLPTGAPVGLYADLAARARARGVPAIVDADGEPLRHAPAGRPEIVKPNAEELARALAHEAPEGLRAPADRANPEDLANPEGAGRPRDRRGAAGSDGVGEALRGAAALRRSGAGAVVVSLGADGLLAVTREGSWRAVMPYRVEGNPTGAGDALVAGLALGLVEGTPWPERLRRAAALGAAAVAAPVAGDFDADVFRDVHPEIRVEPARA
ncbi:1-phosphofructokinase family hexose kinase, partial [Streptosporangium carneum]|uniref:1-phosphofructokinase family hexose kinase n=1 Tax=Streptosporangium carneum TaxID=47481 RepID=UPI0031EA6AEC